ncbi:hypothetical protein [Streptomyces bacillaris]|uniref:hypothetical protein n=1 Tax=Streptomyces bacillaris TaxID=68179 RepID=UPI003467405B
MAHLGTPPCHLLSATGRTIARTPTARALPAAEASRQLASALRVDPEASPPGLPLSGSARRRAAAETDGVRSLGSALVEPGVSPCRG